jgi:hypothetical protein
MGCDYRGHFLIVLKNVEALFMPGKNFPGDAAPNEGHDAAKDGPEY